MFKNINLMLNENEGIVTFVMGFIAIGIIASMMIGSFINWINTPYEGPSNLTLMVEECEADVVALEESVYELIELDMANA